MQIVKEFYSIKSFDGWAGAKELITELDGDALDIVDDLLDELTEAESWDETYLNDWVRFEMADYLYNDCDLMLDGTDTYIYQMRKYNARDLDCFSDDQLYCFSEQFFRYNGIDADDLGDALSTEYGVIIPEDAVEEWRGYDYEVCMQDAGIAYMVKE